VCCCVCRKVAFAPTALRCAGVGLSVRAVCWVIAEELARVAAAVLHRLSVAFRTQGPYVVKQRTPQLLYEFLHPNAQCMGALVCTASSVASTDLSVAAVFVSG
jgi:hypothetical protein